MINIDKISKNVLAYRLAFLSFLALFTFVTIFFIPSLDQTPNFSKTLPTNHNYIDTFEKYKNTFGSANKVIVSIKPDNGSIYNKKSLSDLKRITEDVFYIKGIERSSVTSLFTPNVRYMEIVEDGFKGGNIISANFSGKDEEIVNIRNKVEKSNWNGKIVSRDGSQALVVASLQEKKNDDNNSLDLLSISNSLEEIREKYEKNGTKVYIIGFAKAMGDITSATKSVILFFLIAFLLIFIFLKLYTRSFLLTVSIIICSVVPIIWLLGLMPIFSLGLDPLSILIPFLIFSIAVSHAVQMTNSWKNEVQNGKNSYDSSVESFKKLFVPGTVALLANALGFSVIAIVDIPIVKELVLTAMLGVILMILSNKILLPILLSFFPNFKTLEVSLGSGAKSKLIWNKFGKILDKKPYFFILFILFFLFLASFHISRDLQIGDLGTGVPELRDEARYNNDIKSVVGAYDLAIDNIRVLAEISGSDSPCLQVDVMNSINSFEFTILQNPNVIAIEGMAGVVKKINQAYSENYIAWHAIPNNSIQIAQGVGYATRLGNAFMNSKCSVLPISIFINDHQAKTIQSVIDDVKKFQNTNDVKKVSYRLALGNAGIMGARNEVIKFSEPIVNLALFFSVGFLCYLMFRCIKITFCIVIPLLLVTIMCNALMVFLSIGIKINTLPVIALGVGVGVDYGIYLYERLNHLMRKDGLSLKNAYIESLKQRGSASIFTAFIMSISVFSWTFSELKFQQDMGFLLGFMFIFNMLGAIFLIPVLSKFFNIENEKNLN